MKFEEASLIQEQLIFLLKLQTVAENKNFSKSEKSFHVVADID